MKKILFLLGLLLLIVLAAIVIFIATFDLDSYRPLLVSWLEQAMARGVSLERITLGWRKGLALELKGLALYPGFEKQGEPLVRVGRASGVLEFAPLLNRQVQIGSIHISRPQIRLVREADGTVKGLEPSRPPGEKPGPEKGAALALALLIQSIEVEDGAFSFRDESKNEPLEIGLDQIKLAARGISLGRPVSLEGSARFASQRPNLRLKGTFLPKSPEGKAALEGIRIEGDLGSIDPNELFRGLPALRKGGFPETFEGHLLIEIPSLPLEGKVARELRVRGELSGGRIVFPNAKGSIENVAAKVRVERNQILLDNLSAELAGGNLSASGKIDPGAPRPLVSFQAAAAELRLDQLAPAAGPEEPALQGILSAAFQGTALGNTGPEFVQTFAGQGRLLIQEGALLNFNLVREVFRGLSLIPGLIDRLGARLPEDYQEKLAQRDTVLGPIEWSFTVQDGILVLNPWNVRSDTFELAGAANLSLDGRLQGRAILLLDPDLSMAFLQSVNELQFLTNPEGRIEIPLSLRGRLPEVSVVPDLQYVAARLAVSKTKELVSDWLGKRLEKKEGGAAGGESRGGSVAQDLLGLLFQEGGGSEAPASGTGQ